ncbi:MAG TPA: cysteine--tRNA ligase, partial [Actinomycetota bacterium]|nr:cysteine--tRNA ligase [Actinomycetota bacterium]
PWGLGRPGWHIECSAMAGRYLGRAFDIHGGGEDLIFPHHENEIAQSEGATGEPFARYWLHNAFLELKGEKMAKSVGNVVSPRELLRRHLTASGHQVLLVRNYTDVDDKIINAAGHDPLQAFVVAERWTRVYDEITAALGVQPPDIAPRASGHIPEMLALIARLVDAGLAYQVGGDVYFAVGKWPEYGRLSGRDPAELQAGARVEVNPDKRDPLDFALWKGAKPGEPTWDSPWGPGRPGWHIECSAMAGKYLGCAFDIHGGGEDLIFPHHENEIAQSEGATGEPFARYWLHNAFLELKGEKMAKSVGNGVSPRELLRRHRGVGLRYALLGAHYRSPLEFSEEVLADAAASYDRLATFATNAARALGDPGGSDAGAGSDAEVRDPGGWRGRFQAALDDDLNVPAALAVLFDLVAESNPLIAKLELGETSVAASLQDRFATFLALAGRLGFTPLDDLPDPAAFRPILDLLLDLREQARAARDFAAADAIRDRLAQAGIRVEDRPGGPRWHLIP